MRYLVTGGAGFLGSFPHRTSGKRPVSPTSSSPAPKSTTLTHEAAAENSIKTTQARRCLSFTWPPKPSSIGRQPGQPPAAISSPISMGLHLIEQARIHKIHKPVQVGTICGFLTPSSPPSPSVKKNSGTATPKKPTPLTASPKRPSWSCARPTRQQYGLNAIYLLPVNLYGPRDTFNSQTLPTSSPPLSANASKPNAKGRP